MKIHSWKHDEYINATFKVVTQIQSHEWDCMRAVDVILSHKSGEIKNLKDQKIIISFKYLIVLINNSGILIKPLFGD